MTALLDRTGLRYGRLTVIARADDGRDRSGGLLVRWLCRCECGNTSTHLSVNLRNGSATSCGCFQREVARGLIASVPPPPRRGVVGYQRMHGRLTEDLGPASERKCVDGCGNPATAWSYDHADPDELIGTLRGYRLPYSLKPEHYHPRCASCHSKLDARLGKERRTNEASGG